MKKFDKEAVQQLTTGWDEAYAIRGAVGLVGLLLAITAVLALVKKRGSRLAALMRLLDPLPGLLQSKCSSAHSNNHDSHTVGLVAFRSVDMVLTQLFGNLILLFGFVETSLTRKGVANIDIQTGALPIQTSTTGFGVEHGKNFLV